jgi:hypothetical protein
VSAAIVPRAAASNGVIASPEKTAAPPPIKNKRRSMRLLAMNVSPCAN